MLELVFRIFVDHMFHTKVTNKMDTVCVCVYINAGSIPASPGGIYTRTYDSVRTGEGKIVV